MESLIEKIEENAIEYNGSKEDLLKRFIEVTVSLFKKHQDFMDKMEE